MFAIDDATVVAVRHAFDEHGELAAAVELRRHFAGIGDLAWARQVVRIILRWQPTPADDPIKAGDHEAAPAGQARPL